MATKCYRIVYRNGDKRLETTFDIPESRRRSFSCVGRRRCRCVVWPPSS